MHGYVQEEILVSPLKDKGLRLFKMPTLPSHTMGTQLQIHDAIEMIYVNRGSISVNIDGMKQSLYPGDFAFFRSRGVHSIYTEDCEENDYYVLQMMPKFIFDICSKDVAVRFPNRFLVFNTTLKTYWTKEELAGSEMLHMIELLIGEIDNPGPVTDASRVIYVLGILDQIYRWDYEVYEELSDMPNDILDIVAYINVWFSIDLTAADMAKRANMSYAHFSRTFHKVTGRNFKDYLNLVRINHAEQLVLNTDYPITEIALESGYSTVSHFAETYRKLKGTSPTAARKKARENRKDGES